MEQNKRDLSELSEIESVRLRPALTFGKNDIEGMQHSMYEIVANSIDEIREGHGDTVEIEILADNTITVKDNGRGLPMDWNEDAQKYNWEIALCRLYGSGKYDSKQYSEALGANGVGLTATQYASEFMDVTSQYGGKRYSISFKKGKPSSELKIEDVDSEETGTTITFRPDLEVFLSARGAGTVDAMYFLDLLRKQAMLITRLTVKFKHAALPKAVVIHFENGIQEYIDTLLGDSKMVSETPYFTDEVVGADMTGDEPYKFKMRLAFNFSSEGTDFECYHNNSYLFEIQKNKTVDAVQRAFTKAFDKFAKELSKINSDDKIIYKDIEPLLTCIQTGDAPGYRTFFRNQTKGAVENVFMHKSVAKFVENCVYNWLKSNDKESLKVLNEILAIKRAREEADKVSKKVIAKLSKQVTFLDKPKGFVDCTRKLGENGALPEIYIVEGDSASGATVTARNYLYQAVFPLIGKPANCCKAELSDIVSNKVIIGLYSVLGCGIEAKSKYLKDLPKFDATKLRYDKIIICADADIDGEHIAILLLAMFFVLSPSLLKLGKVYIVQSHLYEIVTKQKSYFAYSDEEKDSIAEKLSENGVKYKVNRSKGLGENTPEVMELTTMSPDTRRLIQLKYPEDPKEQEQLAQVYDIVLGNNITGRKYLISEFFSKVEGRVE